MRPLMVMCGVNVKLKTVYHGCNKMENHVLNFTGNDLRDKGINQAVEHADRVSLNWSERAYRLTEDYAKRHFLFSGEQVRLASKGMIDEPPHLRAWGAIMLKAAKNGLIKRVGYIQVENIAAHRATATLWESKVYEY